jgi:site-specific recombinase XerD
MHMLAAGVPLHTVTELLGHSFVAVTGDVYGHVSTEGARSAVQRLSTAMGW